MKLVMDSNSTNRYMELFHQKVLQSLIHLKYQSSLHYLSWYLQKVVL